MFTKITHLKNSITYVEAEGKLDIYNAPYYLEDVKENIRTTYTRELILEFSKISYVASIGLRAILEIYKTMQARNGILKLKNVNDEVLHAFKFTGFDKFLIIEYDSDDNEEQQTENQNET